MLRVEKAELVVGHAVVARRRARVARVAGLQRNGACVVASSLRPDEAEALLPRDRLMPGEIYKIGERIRAILQIVEIEGRGPQLMLSRSCPEMVTELFSI